MNFEPTESQELIRKTVRDYAEREIAPHVMEYDESGEPLRGIGTVRDITTRKRAEEEAAELQSELNHVTRVTTLGEFAAALTEPRPTERSCHLTSPVLKSRQTRPVLLVPYR